MGDELSSRRNGNPLRYRRRAPQPVGTIIDSTLKKFGLSDEIARYKFVSYWAEIVGEAIAQRSRPEYVKNGSLIVRVKDSTWAQELSFQKNVILNRVRKYSDSGVNIKDIYFVVGEL